MTTESSARRAFEFHAGSKKAYGIAHGDGSVTVRIDCTVIDDACVTFTVPEKALHSYIDLPRNERPPIQTLFADLQPEIREIFVSGSTPAEFDAMTDGPTPEAMARVLKTKTLPKKTLKNKKAYYEALGYTF